MIFFEDLGQELTNILIAIVSIVIIYFAWKSTNVREERLPPTAVLIIESNIRRRLIDSVVREPINIVQNSSTDSNNSNSTEEVDLDNVRPRTPLENLSIPEAPSLQAIIDEVNDLASGANYSNQSLEVVEDSIDEFLEDTEQIIQEMDNPDTTEGLRQRRLAFYEGGPNNRQENQTTTTQSQIQISSRNRRENLNLQTGDFVDNSHAENCSNENNENENISKTENKTSINENLNQDNSTETREDEFRIKLKYLNDDLRLVKGTPNEAIGDFKKRNFTVELAAHKLVRLVFNGHVLQPDSKTLQACGLFDNCVVHCLVHNKKTSDGHSDDGNQNEDQSSTGQPGLGSNTFSNRSGNGPTFVYLGIVFVSLAIVFCWYCRIQYSYLFSWYSTIGLVLMTVLFLVMFPLIILIEREVTN